MKIFYSYLKGMLATLLLFVPLLASADSVSPVGTPIASLEEAALNKTYVLFNPKFNVYAVYSPSHSGEKVWAASDNGSSSVANPDGHHANSVDVDVLDATSANAVWMLCEKDGNKYLYNVGAKKYLLGPHNANRRYASFTDEATALTSVVSLDNNCFAFATIDQSDGAASLSYVCAGMGNSSEPIQCWTSGDVGSCWQLIETSVEADADIVEEYGYDGTAAPAGLAGKYSITYGTPSVDVPLLKSFRGEITIDESGNACMTGLVGSFASSDIELLSNGEDGGTIELSYIGAYNPYNSTIKFSWPSDDASIADVLSAYWTLSGPFKVSVSKDESTGLYTLTNTEGATFSYSGDTDATVTFPNLVFQQLAGNTMDNKSCLVGTWDVTYQTYDEESGDIVDAESTTTLTIVEEDGAYYVTGLSGSTLKAPITFNEDGSGFVVSFTSDNQTSEYISGDPYNMSDMEVSFGPDNTLVWETTMAYNPGSVEGGEALIIFPTATAAKETYVTNYTADDKSTHSGRYPKSLKVTTDEGEETMTLASSTGHKLYWDNTATVVKASAGSNVALDAEYEGTWMHAYAYVDMDNDGEFSYDVDETNHTVLSTSDLRYFSFYSFNTSSDATGYNSNGDYLTEKSRDTSLDLSFTAPEKPGTYRVRYKIDWNSIDPAGAPANAQWGSLQGNGGAIVDFMLEVEEGASVAFSPEGNTEETKFETMPSTVTVTTSASEIGSVTVWYRNDNTLRAVEVAAENVTTEGGVVTISLPEEVTNNQSYLWLGVQLTDANGNVIGDEYNVVEYYAVKLQNVFTVKTADPASESEVYSLDKVTLVMSGVDLGDEVGGIDETKVVNVYNASNKEVVTTATLSLAELTADSDITDWNTVIATLAEKITEPGTYQLVIPEATIYNSAYDSEAEDKGVSWGAIYNPETTLTYYVVAAPNTFAIESATPEAGAVSSLSDIVLTMSGNAGGIDSSKEVVVKDAEGNVVATATLTLDDNVWTNVNVALSEQITAVGTYTLVIPEGTIYDELYDDMQEDFGVSYGATYNADTLITYTVFKFDYVSADPADSSTVKAPFTGVTLTLNGEDIDDYLGGFDKKKVVTVKDSEGNVVTTATLSVPEGESSITNKVNVTFAEPITEAGTYTITIPEGAIFDQLYNSTMEDYNVSGGALYNGEIVLTYTVEPARPLGEPLTSLSEIDPNKTYVLYNKHFTTYAVYDEAQSSENVWIAGLDGNVTPDGGHPLAVTPSVFDSTSVNCSWMIFEKDGKWYAYNMGAEGYLVTPEFNGSLPCTFSAESSEVEIVTATNAEGDTGFAFRTPGTGDTSYMCACLGASPVSIWTSTDNGSVWEVRENPNVAADAAVITATSIGNVNVEVSAKGIYTISGIKLNVTDPRKLQKGLYIIDGKKVIVK